MLAGDADFIEAAWQWKQRLGGAMRQPADVIVDYKSGAHSAGDVAARAFENGLRIGATTPTRFRMLSYIGVSEDDIRTAAQIFRDTLDECHGVLARLTPDDLASPRRVQGFETTALAAVLDSEAHLSGHVQEITYVTRLRLGDRYAFRWVPAKKEQGAAV